MLEYVLHFAARNGYSWKLADKVMQRLIDSGYSAEDMPENLDLHFSYVEKEEST